MNLKALAVCFVLVSVALITMNVHFVSAAVNLNQPISTADQATFDKILEPVMKIYNLVKYLATAVAGFVLLLAGISYMISGSDPKKREQSKSMATYVIIGLFIIWAAPWIVDLVL